jgi:hypothetical protein
MGGKRPKGVPHQACLVPFSDRSKRREEGREGSGDYG